MTVRVLDRGRWRDFRPGDLPPDDRGLALGDGVFETFRASAGGIRRSDAHADRLAAACEALDLPMPDWSDIVSESRRLAAAGSHIMRVTLTRGSGPRGLAPIPDASGLVMLTGSPWSPSRKSLVLHLSSLRRSPDSLSARHKTISYADNAAARREADAAGAGMALLLTSSGAVSGADCANVFALRGGVLRTPSTACAIRPGVTREVVLGLAREAGLAVEEGDYAPDDFLDADALFVTNAAMGIVAVSQCGSRHFDTGQAGLAALQQAEAG
ncbi:aminotransferase class IV [Hyphobacterium marinum]|uniref:Probable branched-chain-amino-acid aminotransferase n=1 Tax=Hyphobacterium marinum TaxID=3116574 RepID=A0ABU7LXQ5_9PROT|nr:aminotransferase class IV [Hyphobacterium sp. Y6023]MEE2565785.1 aminotransferase class IV [Hyphobacterium sp. Y6023]